MSMVELCANGDLEGVKAAVKNGADVNTKDEEGNTGLIWAARDISDIDVLKLLLDVPNIDVNSVNNCGESAVHLAVFEDNIEALKLLLNVPCIDVNIADNNGHSALHAAALWNRLEALKLFLSHPSMKVLTLNQNKDQYGNTPVMFAVKMDRLEHLALLFADLRVDLDTTDKKGKTLEEAANGPEIRKVVDEAKQRRRLIREQQREVSKVLLDGLYDPYSPLSKLLGIRTEVVGEIIWQKMLVENWQTANGKWQIFPRQ